MELHITNYLQHLNIPVSTRYVDKLLASHPHYPSLLSVVDTLNQLAIQYQISRISSKELDNIPFPYLLYSEKGAKGFLIRNERELKQTQQTEDEQSSVVLQVDPPDSIIDEENNKYYLRDSVIKICSGTLVSAVALLLGMSLLSQSFWFLIALVGTALLGVIVGYLLIGKDVGIKYNAIEEFCRSGRKQGCDEILNSEGAELLAGISLSDATATYFLFQFIVAGFLIPLGAGSFLDYLGLLSLLALPFVMYSIYYQSIRAKTWCKLCLMVDAILVLQVAFFGYMYSLDIVALDNINLIELTQIGLLFLIVGSSILLLKDKLKSTKESIEAETKVNRIKNDIDVFLYLLRQQEKFSTDPLDQEIRIGIPEAPIKIIMAASLGCGPCKRGFKMAADLVATYPKSVSLAIRIQPYIRKDSDTYVSPSKYIFAYWQRYIKGVPDEGVRTEQLLSTWYEAGNLEKFKTQYHLHPEDLENSGVEKLEQMHSGWFEESGITLTPSFFINGYRLPTKKYFIDDLTPLIPALIDKFTSNQFMDKEKVATFENAVEEKK